MGDWHAIKRILFWKRIIDPSNQVHIMSLRLVLSMPSTQRSTGRLTTYFYSHQGSKINSYLLSIIQTDLTCSTHKKFALTTFSNFLGCSLFKSYYYKENCLLFPIFEACCREFLATLANFKDSWLFIELNIIKSSD